MKKCVCLFLAVIFIISSCVNEDESNHIYSIAIINKISDIVAGDQYKFIGAYYPFEAEGFEMFIWQSSNNEIAAIDQDGMLKAVGEGVVTIKMSTDVKTEKGIIELFDEVTIRVTAVDIEGIRLNTNSLEITNRSTATLTISTIPANATLKEIEWTSSNVLVATVENGVITAKSIGNTIITAQVKSTNIKAECSVTVRPILLTSMQFKTKDIKMEVGFSTATELIFEPDSAEDKRVIYSSSDPSIAVVNSYGIITCLSEGTGAEPARVEITATSIATGVKATCIVEVISVAELVMVTIEKQDMSPSSLGLSGSIRATLHNYSSKPIHIVRFRILDSFNNYEISIPLDETLATQSSFSIPNKHDEWIQFLQTFSPRAVFTYEVGGKEYRSEYSITP